MKAKIITAVFGIAFLLFPFVAVGCFEAGRTLIPVIYFAALLGSTKIVNKYAELL